jgi:hypothetical protein
MAGRVSDTTGQLETTWIEGEVKCLFLFQRVTPLKSAGSILSVSILV